MCHLLQTTTCRTRSGHCVVLQITAINGGQYWKIFVRIISKFDWRRSKLHFGRWTALFSCIALFEMSQPFPVWQTQEKNRYSSLTKSSEKSSQVVRYTEEYSQPTCMSGRLVLEWFSFKCPARRRNPNSCMHLNSHFDWCSSLWCYS